MKRVEYFAYKRQRFRCEACGWEGLGSETATGELFESGICEQDCPKCHEPVLFFAGPTLQEIMAAWPGLDEEERAQWRYVLQRAGLEP